MAYCKPRRRFPAEPLAKEEVEALIGACSASCVSGVRNAALIATLYRSGVRIGEALALYPKDLSARQGTIQVLHGKGGKQRVVGLDAWGWGWLGRWLEVRSSLGVNGRHRLFCTLRGKPLIQPYVSNMLKRVARHAGVEKRVHCHGLRHSFASQAVLDGVNVAAISQQLGHSNVATTAVYLHRLNPREAIAAFAEPAPEGTCGR